MGKASDAMIIREAEIKKRFIEEFAQSLNQTQACLKIGVPLSNVIKLLDRDRDFRLAKNLCEDTILDNIESRVYRDAEADDNKLAMFLLRTRRRKKFGNDNSTDVNTQLNIQVNLSKVE